jgi:hypothetical protein
MALRLLETNPLAEPLVKASQAVLLQVEYNDLNVKKKSPIFLGLVTLTF